MDAKTVIDTLYKKLDLIKLIKDTYKRKYLNDRIYSTIEYFKLLKPEELVTGIFLIGKKIEEIAIPKQCLDTLKECDVDKFTFKYGDTFHIDFLNKLLFDVSFNNVILFNNSKMTHIHVNSTKKKIMRIIDSKDFNGHILPYLKEVINSVAVFHGVSSYLKNIKFDNSYVVTKYLTDEEVLKIFDDYDMDCKHKMLEECFNYINNEKTIDRIIIGKDIDEGIKNYTIKTLFCVPIMYEKIQKLYSKEYLNFQIIQIRRLKPGDIFDKLKQDYKGVIGISYY